LLRVKYHFDAIFRHETPIPNPEASYDPLESCDLAKQVSDEAPMRFYQGSAWHAEVISRDVDWHTRIIRNVRGVEREHGWPVALNNKLESFFGGLTK
jgi:hypothetical protein